MFLCLFRCLSLFRVWWGGPRGLASRVSSEETASFRLSNSNCFLCPAGFYQTHQNTIPVLFPQPQPGSRETPAGHACLIQVHSAQPSLHGRLLLDLVIQWQIELQRLKSNIPLSTELHWRVSSQPTQHPLNFTTFISFLSELWMLWWFTVWLDTEIWELSMFEINTPLYS